MLQHQIAPDRQAKILVVDDKLDSLDLLSTICMLEGYKVEQCDRGKTAIELASKDPPDLILLDVSMPEMDGFTVCKLLKSNRRYSRCADYIY